MHRTIAFVGARGGHGTTTVATVVALHAAKFGPTILTTDDLHGTCALVGFPWPSASPTVEIAPSLTLAANGTSLDEGAGATVVVDHGRLASGPLDRPDHVHERYLVARGPCYVGLSSVMATGIEGIDGIVLVAEHGRSLTAADVTDVLGVPVVATVTVSPKVARTIDAGLLTDRFHLLRDLAALRTLGPPAATASSPHRSTPKHVTDLPLSPCDNGGRRADREIRVALSVQRPHVGGMWRPPSRCRRAEHRAPRAGCGRLLRR